MSSLLRNSTLETVFRPFPKKDKKQESKKDKQQEKGKQKKDFEDTGFGREKG